MSNDRTSRLKTGAKTGDRIAELAAEQVGLKVNVIVVDSTGPALVAKKKLRQFPSSLRALAILWEQGWSRA